MSSSSSSNVNANEALKLVVEHYMSTAAGIGLAYRTCKGVKNEEKEDGSTSYLHRGFDWLRRLVERLKKGHIEVCRKILKKEEDECILAENETENGGLFRPCGLSDVYEQLAHAVLRSPSPHSNASAILNRGFAAELQLAVIELGNTRDGDGSVMGCSKDGLSVKHCRQDYNMRVPRLFHPSDKSHIRACRFPTINMQAIQISTIGVIAGNHNINTERWTDLSIATFTRVLLKLLCLFRSDLNRSDVWNNCIPCNVKRVVCCPLVDRENDDINTLTVAMHVYEALLCADPLIFEDIQGKSRVEVHHCLEEWAIKYSEPEF